MHGELEPNTLPSFKHLLLPQTHSSTLSHGSDPYDHEGCDLREGACCTLAVFSLWDIDPSLQGGQIAVKEHPVPSIADDEILVKTAAFALNPSDHKGTAPSTRLPKCPWHAYVLMPPGAVIDWNLGTEGSIVGYDFSGIVVKAGKDITAGPKVGDPVAGFVHGAMYPDEGAFAEYVKASADLVWTVPENTFSHELAAAYGAA